MYSLYYASTSAFVRKVMVSAHCLGLVERITLLDSAAHPVQRDARIATCNPLAKVPALYTADGLALYDSRVICEYLNEAAGGSLFPPPGPARWQALTRLALGDGLVDAALLARYELTARPAEKQWPTWRAAQLHKVQAVLAELERQLSEAALSPTPDDIGLIALGCALGYLDFRFAELNWRATHPRSAVWFDTFEQHPAMLATRPFA